MDNETKLSPLGMVAREVATHSGMGEFELKELLNDVLDHMRDRARASIVDDAVDAVTALEYAKQYKAVAQTLQVFGTQLIALEDIEEADAEPYVSRKPDSQPN